MITRRGFAARLGMGAAAARMMPEMAYAQRAAVAVGDLPKDMVWLNANENPAGPPAVSIAAMREVLPTAGRYHYQEFRRFYEMLAKFEDLTADQLLVGAGSTEVLHTAVDAFTSDTRPMITVQPTFEGPVELVKAWRRKVIPTKLRPDYTPDVKRLVEEADKARGGLIYICNPNNPTSTFTTKSDLAWLVSNLPANTILMVDEAYIHFGESPELESALDYVRQGKDVIVTRTFSKIYGMAGLRAGFACARPDLIERMAPFRNNVISIVTAHAVTAAVAEAKQILPERRASMAHTRRELCGWLRERKVSYLEPQANFIMIDVGRNAREFINTMPRMGVAPGRPFPPLDNLLRVTIGTDPEMARFREVFWKVYKG
jgi:histidinol-phosphate aminotransferase